MIVGSVFNFIQTSRPLLVFDAQFDTEPHLMLVKELFTQTFGTPRYHPKSQPFIGKLQQYILIKNKFIRSRIELHITRRKHLASKLSNCIRSRK